jgi:hypothetical protein
MSPLGKTGYEERLDQEELLGRLGLIFAWVKDLIAQLHAAITSNERRKQIETGVGYLKLIEWMTQAALHKALAKNKREHIGAAFSYPRPGIDAPCPCASLYPCHLALLTPDELSQRLKISRQRIRQNLAQYQNALNALGMAESDPLWPETKLATTPTSVAFRAPHRRAIFGALTTLGLNADYKAVFNLIKFRYQKLVLPPRLRKRLPFQSKKVPLNKIELLSPEGDKTEFAELFDKEVSYVRMRMR